jgi:hypothetical protein
MTTPKTASPELVESQADKEEDHNEAIRRVEAGAGHYLVVDKDLTAPPGSCADGAQYIVASPATGDWAGHEGDIAIASGTNASNGWYFREPEEGVFAWVQDETPPLHYWDVSTSPGTWQDYATGVVGSLALDDLSDVQAATPADGDVLTYDSDSPNGWKALPPVTGPTTLDGLSDVDTTGVADGYIIVYEDSPTGWRAVPRRLDQFWYDQIACSDEETALEVGVATTWRQIGGVVVDGVRASLTAAEVDGLVVVDIKKGGVSVLSSLIVIDQNSKTSVGSSPQPVISDNVWADNSEMSVEIVSTGGASPITAAGLKIQVYGRFLAS